MTSSNAVAESAPVIDSPAGNTPAAVDGGAAARSNTFQSNASPFELLPTGDAFGVCDIDGECH